MARMVISGLWNEYREKNPAIFAPYLKKNSPGYGARIFLWSILLFLPQVRKPNS